MQNVNIVALYIRQVYLKVLVGCKHEDSDVCNDCKRQWIHKDDKFELNLYEESEYEAICRQ